MQRIRHTPRQLPERWKTALQKTPLGALALLRRAAKAGAQVGAVCRTMHSEQGRTAVRRILGVLSLAKKYGAASDLCR
jgi:hypothetical protein